MSCRKGKLENFETSPNIIVPLNKKTKPDDEAARLKKANRQKENLRQMLIGENPDDQDTKKKNAIYAYNYFEKVEETFINCGQEFKFKKFLQILKSFDPDADTGVILYNKLEKLFLPDNPELLDIFLTFLQPTEAYHTGKFFDHFVVSNMGTFINKLNIYFNKQPAQIRKIYNSLAELSEDTNLTLDKIKRKILPLLKGNQFLIDWFLQMFSEEKPPESLLVNDETVNLKEFDTGQGVISCETLQTKDLLDDIIIDGQGCQLKYINGRIFYGSRLLLPAKLGFMLESQCEDQNELNEDSIKNELTEVNKCVHGIRQLGEEYLRVKDINNGNYENGKLDDYQNKEISTYEFCDEAILRMHAARLNPSLYSSENFSGNFLKNNRIEDGKCSPKKQFSKISLTATFSSKEKYKSPKKNFFKTQIFTTNNINKKGIGNEPNALTTARKIKILCEEEMNENQTDEQNKMKRRKMQKAKFKCQVNGSDCQLELTESESSENDYNECISNILQKTQPWTREEDRIILEEVKLGFQIHDELMKRIEKKLNGRIQAEISIRFKFLMDLLSQLQNKS